MSACVNTGVSVICTGVYGLEHEGLYVLGVCGNQDGSNDVSDGFMSSVLPEGPYPSSRGALWGLSRSQATRTKGAFFLGGSGSSHLLSSLPQNNHLNII